VVFASDASNLVRGDRDGTTDVFLHDTVTGKTTALSTDTSGQPVGGFEPTISSDGSTVAFVSPAVLTPNAVAGFNIYVRNLSTGAIQLASRNSAGLGANNDSFNPTLSSTGRYIAFWSYASNLVAGDANGVEDVFVVDLSTGVTTLASVGTNGQRGNGGSDLPVISGNGRYVVFWSLTSNFAAGDTNNAADVFIRDRVAATTTLVSANGSGRPANGFSDEATTDNRGDMVAFASIATNLVVGDRNGTLDVFVWTH
jgi:Tol biopolymer transport system component